MLELSSLTAMSGNYLAFPWINLNISLFQIVGKCESLEDREGKNVTGKVPL